MLKFNDFPRNEDFCITVQGGVYSNDEFIATYDVQLDEFVSYVHDEENDPSDKWLEALSIACTIMFGTEGLYELNLTNVQIERIDGHWIDEAVVNNDLAARA